MGKTVFSTLLAASFTMIFAAFGGERMDYLDNGIIRLGVDLDIGGSITCVADAKNRLNVVNSHDWGRQIQQSYYSGPVPFGDPKPEWKGLGWNPIQSGDCYNNRAKVLAHTNDGKVLYTKTQPMQWPLNNVPGDCVMETWIELDDSTAKVRCRLTNVRSDRTWYPARSQELPAIYTNGVYWKLMTYTGAAPFTHGELTRIPKIKPVNGFPWSHFNATESWAALVNDQNWGLGIHIPGIVSFLGGFNGEENKGGDKDVHCGYISPLANDILDHNIVYEYGYTLILGNLADIRRYVYAHKPVDMRPDYRFIKDRQHCAVLRTTDSGWPIDGKLRIRCTKDDPQLVCPVGLWKAEEVPTIYLRAATQAKQNTAQLFFKRFGDTTFDSRRCINVDLIADGQFHTYEFDLQKLQEYKGAIIQLRLDPVIAGSDGEYFDLEYLGWKKPE